MDKEQHLVVCVEHKFINGTSTNFNADMKVPFIPNEVVIRQLTYRAAGAADFNAYGVRCEAFGGQIGSVFDGSQACPGTHITLDKPINGSFQFSVTLLGLTTVVPDGYLSIALEFVRQRTIVEQKDALKKDQAR